MAFIKSMDKNLFEKILEGQPNFRLKQVKKALFSDLIENWEQASTLPKELREKLTRDFPIGKEFKDAKLFSSKGEDAIKALFTLEDNCKIESVLMKHGDERNTVCVSCQVGCSLGCEFCATGQQGLKRNLDAQEITGQILFFAKLLKKSGEKITNVVFMGMGEPFMNYDEVMAAIKILNDKDGFNLGSRHISISTAGITEGIEKLAKEPLQVNLAISLHAPNNTLRSKLMPINKTYPIEKILASVDNYIIKTKRRVMFEYLMIRDVNDSEKNAGELASLMKNKLYFVNLISFNPVGHSEFKPSSGQQIKKFKEILEKSGINTTQRHRFGKEIKAACGQLTG